MQVCPKPSRVGVLTLAGVGPSPALCLGVPDGGPRGRMGPWGCSSPSCLVQTR